MQFSARAAALALHAVPHMLNRHGERVLMIVGLLRNGPQILCHGILNDDGTCRGRPEGRLQVVGDAVDDARMRKHDVALRLVPHP